MASRPIKKSRAKGAPGVKMLLTAASMAATLWGWAALTAQEPIVVAEAAAPVALPAQRTLVALAPPPMPTPTALDLPPLPTVMPLIPPPDPIESAANVQPAPVFQPQPEPVQPQPQPAQPQPQPAQPALRVVAAPPPAPAPAPAAPAPVTNTQSSR